MAGPTYTGERDGLHWWDTPNGPMGLTPDMASQLLPGPGALDAPPDNGAQPYGGPAPQAPPPIMPMGDVQGSLPQGGDAGPPAMTGFDDVRTLAPVTVSNDYRGKGGAKRLAGDKANVTANGGQAQQLAPTQQAQAPGPTQFDGSLESAIVRQGDAYDAYGKATQAQVDVDMRDADAQAKLQAEAEQRRLAVQAQQEQARAAEEAQRQKYQADVTRMVDEHTKKEVDRGRLMKNASTGKKIGLALSVAMAGIGSAMKGQGDRNPALDVVMGAINDDVNDQVAAIEKSGADVQMRQGLYQQFLQQTGNAEAARGATMARMVADAQEQLKVAIAQTGSERARANGMATLAELGIKRGEFENGAANALTARDMQRQQLEEQIRARRAAAGAAAAARKDAAARDARDFTEGVRRFNADLRGKADAAAAAGNADQAAALNKQADEVTKRGVGGPPKLVTGPDGKPVMMDDGVTPKIARGEPLKNDDGSIFMSGTPEEAASLRDRMASSRELTRIMDNAVRIYDANGGESDSSNSDALQQVRSDWAQAKLMMKDSNKLGALSASDMVLVDGALGTSDPTQFRSKVAGIKNARRNVESLLNSYLESRQYTGSAISFPDLSELTGATTSAENKAFLEKLPWGTGTSSYTADKSPEVLASYGLTGAAADQARQGYSQSQRVMVSAAQARMNSPNFSPKQREAARAQLEATQRDASSPALRDLAKRALAGESVAVFH